MNALILAAAGSGKTHYIVDSGLRASCRVGIFTFTNDNELQIIQSMYRQRGCIPDNVYISSWFSFLLKHGVRPFQSFIWNDRIKGMNLVSSKSGFRFNGRSGPVYWGEDSTEQYYFDSSRRIYSDKVAKFAVRCNELSGGAVLRRLRRILDVVYVDEVQDLAGYDLEVLRLLMLEGVEVTAVGDPRQCIYQTHIDQKYRKYSGPAISEFFRVECRGTPVVVDETTLNRSFRNSSHIIQVSAALYPELPIPESMERTESNLHGVHFISETSQIEFLRATGAVQLRYSASERKTCRNYPALNIGKSKGLEFNAVLLVPTSDMQSWLLGEETGLKERTRALLYVALTRARQTVAVMINEAAFRRLPGMQSTNGLEHCRVARIVGRS